MSSRYGKFMYAMKTLHRLDSTIPSLADCSPTANSCLPCYLSER